MSSKWFWIMIVVIGLGAISRTVAPSLKSTTTSDSQSFQISAIPLTTDERNQRRELIITPEEKAQRTKMQNALQETCELSMKQKGTFSAEQTMKICDCYSYRVANHATLKDVAELTETYVPTSLRQILSEAATGCTASK